MPRNTKKLEEEISKAMNRKQKAIAYYNLALFHDNNAREIEAIPNYKMALKLGLGKDLKSKALAWLASSLYKTGKQKEALKITKQAMRQADKKLQKFLTGLQREIAKSIRI